MYAVGIDLGGTSIKGALVHQEEGLIADMSRPTEASMGPRHVLDRMANIVSDLKQKVPKNERLLGIGVGSPGAINLERTTVSDPPNLHGWDVVHMRDELQTRLETDLPVIVENDANVAGLGSAHYGAGIKFDSFIMVTLGTGVGGSIIYNNRIFRGATGGAGEIGHMTIDYEGPLARSGVHGAIEAYLGQRFLSRHARFQLLNEHDSVVHERAGEDLKGITPRMLHEAAMDGDEPARRVLKWAGHKLGCVLASAVNLLDIRKIVVGGGISNAGNYILKPARTTLVRYVVPGLRDGLEIVRETSGNDVAMLGAAHLLFAVEAPVSTPASS